MIVPDGAAYGCDGRSSDSTLFSDDSPLSVGSFCQDSGSTPQQLWQDAIHSSKLISAGGGGLDAAGSVIITSGNIGENILPENGKLMDSTSSLKADCGKMMSLLPFPPEFSRWLFPPALPRSPGKTNYRL
jgi:hypothetical protein